MATKTCSISNVDCGPYYAKGYCNFHWQRWRKGIDLRTPKLKMEPQAGICDEQTCQRERVTRGYCHTHYMQFHTHGRTWDITHSRRKGREVLERLPCQVEGCTEPRSAYFLCARHAQQRSFGTLRFPGDPECAIDYCWGVPGRGSVLCQKHVGQCRRFNISRSDLIALYASAENGCEICGSAFSMEKLPQIDHDHSCCPQAGRSCGRCIRGVLCSSCNHGLGAMKDDPERLIKAAAYLNRS